MGQHPAREDFSFQVEYFGRPGYGTWLYGDECVLPS